MGNNCFNSNHLVQDEFALTCKKNSEVIFHDEDFSSKKNPLGEIKKGEPTNIEEKLTSIKPSPKNTISEGIKETTGMNKLSNLAQKRIGRVIYYARL